MSQSDRFASWSEVERESQALYQGLLRIDTTNPPGNERLAADYLAQSLREDGLEPWIVEPAPGRANLVVRLPATDPDPSQGPLLLAGHTDVVPAHAPDWTHPPFAGLEADGHIWGRGALDMKNMVAMSAMCIKLLARRDAPRRRDVIFAAVADEEEGCTYGSQFLVDHHPDRVRAEFMLGEVGGFWMSFGGQTYVPIMVAEKGRAHLRLRARGTSAHASQPHADNALVRLSRAVERVGTTRLPYQLSPVMAGFIRALIATQPAITGLALRGLLDARTVNLVLDRVLPDKDLARNFNALLRNTASPTMITASNKLNTQPGEAVCDVDGRILPGQSLADLIAQLREVIQDPHVAIEVVSAFEAVSLAQVESPLYDLMTDAVRQAAPQARCVPYMIPGFTDAQSFSQLGTRCYGFSPLKIEPDSGLRFSTLFHGVDERVPVAGYQWGQRVLWDVVSRWVER